MDRDGIAVQVHNPDGAPTIVLVHGALDRGATFRSVLGHLDGVRLVTYDRRGHGRSIAAAPVTGLADHARDLLAIVAEQPHPRVVVAHSYGGLVAMLASTLEPDAFVALGVWEPALVWLDWWPQRRKDYFASVAAAEDPDQFAEALARSLLGEDAWARLDEAGRARRRAEGRTFQVDMAAQLSAPFDFDAVTVPTVVGYGTETIEDRRVAGPWLADRLPKGRVLAVPGADHMAQRSHPEAFAGFVREVLALVPQ